MSIDRTIMTDARIYLFNLTGSDMLRMDVAAITSIVSTWCG